MAISQFNPFMKFKVGSKPYLIINVIHTHTHTHTHTLYYQVSIPPWITTHYIQAKPPKAAIYHITFHNFTPFNLFYSKLCHTHTHA